MMLTVVILTHNSEKQLPGLMEQLGFANQVLIVDDESSDETRKLATSWGAKVFRSPLNNDFSRQRNLAMGKVKSGWVLFLDPDERLTGALIEEVKQVIKSKESLDGYQIKREDMFLGKKLRWGETREMWLTRLGKVNVGQWERPVHEVWKIQKVGRLKQPLVHEPHQNFYMMKNKIEWYASIEAEYRCRLGWEWSMLEMLSFPVAKFLYSYIWERGFWDGWRGLVMSGMMSWHSFQVRWMMGVKQLGNGIGGRNLEQMVGLGVLVVYGLLPWGQLLRVEGVLGRAVYGYEGVMVVTILAWVGLLLIRRTKPLILPWGGLTLVLLGTLGSSLLLNLQHLTNEWFSASLYWWKLVIYVMFGGMIVDLYLRKIVRFDYRMLLNNVGVAWAILALMQYLAIPDTRFLYSLGWDDHYYRAVGTIFDPGFLGLLLVMTLVMLWRSKRVMRNYEVGLVVVGLLLTYARSAYVVGILVLGWGAFRWKRWAGLGILSVLFGVGVYLLPRPGGEGVRLSRTFSIVERAKSVVVALDVFEQSPIWGVGFNAYPSVVMKRDDTRGIPVHPAAPDNTYAWLLATSGVVGLGVFLVWIGYLLWRYRWIGEIKLTILVIGIHAMTSNSWYYPLVMLWLMAMVVWAEGKLGQLKNSAQR